MQAGIYLVNQTTSHPQPQMPVNLATFESLQGLPLHWPSRVRPWLGLSGVGMYCVPVNVCVLKHMCVHFPSAFSRFSLVISPLTSPALTQWWLPVMAHLGSPLRWTALQAHLTLALQLSCGYYPWHSGSSLESQEITDRDSKEWSSVPGKSL